jgi:membrane protein DedA with SNARE-associated domain
LLRSGYVSRIVPEGRLLSLQERVRRGGPFFIFVIRFLPGIRTALFFAAGSLKLPFRHLFIFDGLAALIELPLLVYGVRYVGGRWQEIMALFGRFQGAIVVAVLLLLAAWMLRGWHRRRAGKVGDFNEP